MKKNFGIILAIGLGLTALLLTIAFQAGWVKASPVNQERAGAPSMVSYQGQIWVEDTPFDGKGSFMFAIINSANETTWSNDGDPTPTTPVTLPVTNGLFSVNLGEIDTENGMLTELDPRAFNDPISYLRVWFSPDGGDFTQMPDQPIASVPYALQAQNAQNSDTLNGLTSTAFQLRVTGTCSVGQAVRAINSNGTVVCETLAAAPTFTLSTIDSTGYVGAYSSMAIGTDGLGLISYVDATNNDLKVAHCTDTNCSSAISYTLDSTGDVGWYTSIAIGTDGFGLISYFDNTNDDLKIAHCNDTACSSATSTTLDSAGDVGWYTSIAIGADGLGLISYFDETHQELKVAHCNNIACSSALSNIVDSTGTVGYDTDIAIGTDGLGLISYYDAENLNLKVAHCSNAVCSSALVSTLDSADDVGRNTSITIGRDGLGLISYLDLTNGDLKVAHCDNIFCFSAYLHTLDYTAATSHKSSIAIGFDGFGVISYRGDFWGSLLKIAHCVNEMCSDATVNTLDSTLTGGTSTSIVIGGDSLPLISYDDGNTYDLKVAHCSNELCIPINWEH